MWVNLHEHQNGCARGNLKCASYFAPRQQTIPIAKHPCNISNRAIQSDKKHSNNYCCWSSIRCNMQGVWGLVERSFKYKEVVAWTIGDDVALREEGANGGDKGKRKGKNPPECRQICRWIGSLNMSDVARSCKVSNERKWDEMMEMAWSGHHPQNQTWFGKLDLLPFIRGTSEI